MVGRTWKCWTQKWQSGFGTILLLLQTHTADVVPSPLQQQIVARQNILENFYVLEIFCSDSKCFQQLHMGIVIRISKFPTRHPYNVHRKGKHKFSVLKFPLYFEFQFKALWRLLCWHRLGPVDTTVFFHLMKEAAGNEFWCFFRLVRNCVGCLWFSVGEVLCATL